VFNAANEVAVDAFCAGRLGFPGITETIEAVLEEHLASGHVGDDELTLEAVLEADVWARKSAGQRLGES